MSFLISALILALCALYMPLLVFCGVFNFITIFLQAIQSNRKAMLMYVNGKVSHCYAVRF